MLRKITSTFILLSGLTMAYSQGLTDSIITACIAGLDTARTPATLQRLANDFERLALADEHNWLAHYYTAYTYVQLAYLAKGEQIDVYGSQAESYLENAGKLRPGNSEIYALYAYLYGAKVNVDPVARGAEMGRKSARYIDLSIQADPGNPRPYLVRAMGICYTPKAFGGGSEKAIPYLEKALEKFNTFIPQNANAPNWGRALAVQLLKECLKK